MRNVGHGIAARGEGGVLGVGARGENDLVCPMARTQYACLLVARLR